MRIPSDDSGQGQTAKRDLNCPSCGYDLRGHDGPLIRCPECGLTYRRDRLRRWYDPRLASLRRIDRAIVAVLAAMSVAVAALAYAWGAWLCLVTLAPLCVVLISLIPRGPRR